MNSVQSLDKVIHIGYSRDTGDIFCKISITARKEGGYTLSITGVEGPKANGDCVGGCGQIVGSGISVTTYAQGWDKALLDKFISVWNEYHLNDMKAGSPRQEKYLRDNPLSYAYPTTHYDAAKAALSEAGLQPDPHLIFKGVPYSYGSKWLFQPLPYSVFSFLDALPSTDKEPHWV
jgi:hypothetical protein